MNTTLYHNLFLEEEEEGGRRRSMFFQNNGYRAAKKKHKKYKEMCFVCPATLKKIILFCRASRLPQSSKK